MLNVDREEVNRDEAEWQEEIMEDVIYDNKAFLIEKRKEGREIAERFGKLTYEKYIFENLKCRGVICYWVVEQKSIQEENTYRYLL